MARNYWGREARLYVAVVTYDEITGEPIDPADDDLLEVTRTQDLGLTEEATDMKAEARDLEYGVHAQGGKDLSVETECLLALDEAADDDKAAIRAASDDGTELWVLLTRQDRHLDSGGGLLAICEVFGWPKKLPENGVETATLTFKPSRTS